MRIVEKDANLWNNLRSKEWRLNNLYRCKNKQSIVVDFLLNRGQTQLLHNHSHHRQIILKSRQIGFTTFFCIETLDLAMVKPNVECGIASYGQVESRKIVQRLKLAHEHLDPAIKEIFNFYIVKDNENIVKFSNGSEIKIGNFRGDTIFKLHLTELSELYNKAPDRAEEMMTGTMEAVPIDGKATIECTAKGKNQFYDLWVKYSKLDRELTPLDYECIFFSWHIEPTYTIDLPVSKIPPLSQKDDDYFNSLPFAKELTPQQKYWYIVKRDALGTDKMKQEYPSTPDEAFEASIKGTFYTEIAHLIDYTEQYYADHYTHIAVDLGMNDQFVMLFFQVVVNPVTNRKEIYIINAIEDTNKGIDFYAEIAREFAKKKGYKYGNTIVPFDAQNKELTSAKTRLEIMNAMGFNCFKLERQPVQEGIENVMHIISNSMLHINPELTGLINAIHNYKRQFHAPTNTFTHLPLHDKHSHYADALRYLCSGFNEFGLRDYIDNESDTIAHNSAFL